MPHQCLACGTIIPSGSQDILKGCSNCGGKKFFYITKPISNKERLEILHRVEKEREALLSKANENLVGYVKEFMDRMQEKEEDKDFLTDTDIENMFQDAWMKVRSDRGEEPSKEKGKKVKDEEWFKKYLEPPKVEVVRDKKPPKKTKGKGKDKRKKYGDAVKGAKARLKGAKGKGKGKSPDVIKVLETGVYEIDIKALLEDSPIIVQRDGTYLINLESVFDKLGKKKSKKKRR